MEKVLIICHGDCDGLTAGAIALAANRGARIWITSPVRLDNDLKRVKGNEKRVIITDIALNERSYKDVFTEMKRIEKLGSEITYIDHHPLPDKVTKKSIPATTVVHKTKGCAAELTYLHFEKNLTWQYRILAAIGSIGDYEADTIFAQEVMRDYDGRSLAFQAALIVQALGEINSADALKIKKSFIERMALGALPSELNNLVEKAMRGSYIERLVRTYVHENAKAKKNIGYILDIPTGGGFTGKGALFAATATDKPVGVCGNSLGSKITVSLRRRDPNIDLNIATRAVSKETGISGGGHPAAAGASVRPQKWEKFLDLIDFEINKQIK
ncbi:MAG: DHHA1 domain-containing protein [Candidatus Heimdallarchaeota archaeon]